MRDVWLPNEQNMATASEFPRVVGDGRNDDTAGLQAALDSGASIVFLPTPPGNYLISRTLAIHSGKTLLADRNAVIRLADHAHVHMLTNADRGASPTSRGRPTMTSSR